LDGESARRKGHNLHRTTQTQNKRRQTSMPLVGFELTIPVFERAKTIHALNRAATVIGMLIYQYFESMSEKFSVDEIHIT
jgi:hypothetical protein